MVCMKEIGWKMCVYCPALKFLQHKIEGQSASEVAGQKNLTDYTSLYITHMDKKGYTFLSSIL